MILQRYVTDNNQIGPSLHNVYFIVIGEMERERELWSQWEAQPWDGNVGKCLKSSNLIYENKIKLFPYFHTLSELGGGAEGE